MSSTTFSNPSSTFGAGQMQFGARASMQIDQKNSVRAEALLSEDRVNGGRRKGALLAYERAISRLFRAEVGYRWAEETTAPVDTATAITPGATPNETNAIGVKVTGMLPNRRGSASIDFEQDVVNTDQRRAALAAEYWVFPRLRLYGRYEMLSSFAGPYALNGAQRLAQAVVGFDLAYFRDGQFFSEYRARDAFSGREAEATIGLRNRWQVAPGVRVDASFERVNPIKGGDGAEATAVTAAVEYTRSPLWKGTLRAEYRNATSGDNFLATLGYARKLTRDWTLPRPRLLECAARATSCARAGSWAWRGAQTDENKWNGLAPGGAWRRSPAERPQRRADVAPARHRGGAAQLPADPAAHPLGAVCGQVDAPGRRLPVEDRDAARSAARHLRPRPQLGRGPAGEHDVGRRRSTACATAWAANSGDA